MNKGQLSPLRAATRRHTTLERIEQRLSAIEETLTTHVSVSEVKQAIEDVFATYGLVVQLAEVYTTQRNELAALIALVSRLLSEERAHDAIDTSEREAIRALLVQLREIGRKHIARLSNIEQAVGGLETPAEAVERRAQSA
jgi:hypothetical protein